MGKYIALSIGVAHAGKLASLPGAIHGAKEFRNWAEKQGYEAPLVTDESEEVTVQRLKTAIKGIIDEGEAERLIIYFAGHGIEPSVNTAYWLLSRWEEDSDEAVNVNLSLSNAKRSGIRQIAIFADACRSWVHDAASVGGSSIFPKAITAVTRLPQWDEFFASRLGASAQEVSAQGSTEAYGIFTRCVMRALHGEEKKAIINQPPRVVTSDTLANYLEEAVPLESGKIPGAAVQFPELIAGWRSPNDVYFEVSHSPKGLKVGKSPDKEKQVSGIELVEAIDLHYAREEVSKARLREDKLAEDTAERYYGAYVRPRVASDFTPKQVSKWSWPSLAKLKKWLWSGPRPDISSSLPLTPGLTLVGSEARSVWVQQNKDADLIWDRSRIYAHGDEPLSILIELTEGNWLGSCLLPGFVGKIVVENGLAASVSYAPAIGGFDSEWYADSLPVLSRWTALMQQGRVGDYKELRNFERRNPSLGIIAAYAYERVGDVEAINGIAEYFAHSRALHSQAVTFDVALLSTKPIHRTKHGLVLTTEAGDQSVAGSFPLMTQGWSFLDHKDDFLPLALFEVRKGLLPALWTTFRQEEGKRAAEFLKQGEM